MDKPIAVFAGKDGPGVLIDRCPHRNAALSEGRVRDGALECPYHGWRFARDGACVLTPGAAEPARHGAEALPTEAHAGLVWTTLNPHPAPFPAPPHPVGAQGYDTFVWAVRPSPARLIDAVENLLDPAHPHFLHSGIVRTDAARRPVEVTVRTAPDHAEAIYLEEAKPSGLLPRLLEGKRGVSIGRFFPPSVGQVAFETEGKLSLAITVFFTPESPESVRPFAHFATPEGRAPAFLKEWVLRAFHVPILVQDRAALAAQRANIARFGAPKYALGPLDFLLPAIQRLAEGEPMECSERKFEVSL
jgi:phenylpropionate dioxygenase-like ring-hydroxylating dioxygenase large terminal subunit